MQFWKKLPLSRHELSAYSLFMAASLVGMALVAARIVATRNLSCLYLPWNLFLAWVPLGFALLARALASATPRRIWLLAMVGAGWLLFLPNAPYILTDLMHLARVRPGASAPLWYDLLLHLVVATTGLFLGFASLALMQGVVTRACGRLAGWGFAVVALALSGFGIYVGRFLRWNSWDALIAPGSLLADVADRLLHPLSNPRAYGFSFLCFVFLLLSYLMCFSLPRLRLQPAAEPDA
jgi:uncharacterized membrane protein